MSEVTVLVSSGEETTHRDFKNYLVATDYCIAQGADRALLHKAVDGRITLLIATDGVFSRIPDGKSMAYGPLEIRSEGKFVILSKYGTDLLTLRMCFIDPLLIIKRVFTTLTDAELEKAWVTPEAQGQS